MQNNNFPGDPEEPNEVPGADDQKSITLTIPSNLARPVRNYPGIIVRQHRMGLLKEQYAE